MCQTPCVRAFELWSRVRRASGTLARLAQVWGGAARWSPHRRASAGRAHTRLSLFVNLINVAELVKHKHTQTHTHTHTQKLSLWGPLDCRSCVDCRVRRDRTDSSLTVTLSLSALSLSRRRTPDRGPTRRRVECRDTPPHKQARQPPRQSRSQPRAGTGPILTLDETKAVSAVRTTHLKILTIRQKATEETHGFHRLILRRPCARQ